MLWPSITTVGLSRSTGDPSIIELQVTLVLKNYRWPWYYRTTSDPGIIKSTGDPGNIDLQVTWYCKNTGDPGINIFLSISFIISAKTMMEIHFLST